MLRSGESRDNHANQRTDDIVVFKLLSINSNQLQLPDAVYNTLNKLPGWDGDCFGHVAFHCLYVYLDILGKPHEGQ